MYALRLAIISLQSKSIRIRIPFFNTRIPFLRKKKLGFLFKVVLLSDFSPFSAPFQMLLSWMKSLSRLAPVRYWKKKKLISKLGEIHTSTKKSGGMSEMADVGRDVVRIEEVHKRVNYHSSNYKKKLNSTHAYR